MSIIEKIRRQRIRRAVREDNRRREYWTAEAERAVTVGYTDGKTVLTVSGVPLYRVTNETDIASGTLAFCDLDREVARLRESFLLANVSRPLP